VRPLERRVDRGTVGDIRRHASVFTP
jgi:hypothetical protein